MAKINFGGVVQDARGKQNGLIYSKNRYGSYVKRKVTPINPRTTAQTEVRSNFSSLTKGWGSELSATQITGWNTFATLFPRTDVFGNAKVLSGQNMFISLNQRMLQAGQPILLDPPVNQDVIPIPIDPTTLLATGGEEQTITLTGTAAPPPDTIFYVWSQAPYGQGRQPISNSWRFIGVATPAPTTPWTNAFGTLYTDVFASIATGQVIAMLVSSLNTDNGAVATGIICTNIAG